jgi:glycosyltransferase involved in cell wall biosynthesis
MGGVERNLVDIREFLRERGIPVSVINLTRHRKAEGDGIYYPRSVVEVVQRLLGLQFDVAHLHIGGHLSYRLLALGFVCSLLPRVKTVLTFHSGGFPSTPEGRAAAPGKPKGFLLRRFDALIAVNEEIAELFRRYGVGARKVRVILPYAFPAEIAASLPPAMEEFTRAHSPLLVTVSGLEPEYDIPTQIEALGEIRREFPRAGLMVIGGGSLEAQTRAAAAARPWSEHVLVAGDVPHAVALRAVEGADLFLRTTLYDGDAISVREALHLGVPVIATDNGMRPAGVHVVPVSSPSSVAAKAGALLGDGGRARGGAGGGPVRENLEAVAGLYEELIND